MNSLGIVSLPVFFGLTVVLVGFAAYMTGQALANSWQPQWQVAVYCLLLGLLDRFLGFALFNGALLSPAGYLIDSAVLTAIGLFAFRFTRAYRMVNQYPWLYERVGLFGWREKERVEAEKKAP